jgi:hypothetical protein
MFEKENKFYADWRDATGKRLRKSFTSKRAALQFEAEQKEKAHPKTKARGNQSRRSYAPGTRQQAPEPISKPSRATSSPRLTLLRHKNSAPPTSKK